MTLRLMALMLPAVLVAVPAAAQDRPAGWQIRPDGPDADLSRLEFVGMPPGWHITTGPSVILWDPARTASGTFRLEAEIFFFREGSRDTEGYGLFLGGRNLNGPDQDYLYFLLRNDGAFLVKHRAGDETHTIQDWTPHAAVVRHTGESTGATARNVIAVVAEEATVRFLVNDQEVAAFPRLHMNVDGIVGLRVNHGLNLHVSRLEVR